jgi:stage II sporulation protein E
VVQQYEFLEHYLTRQADLLPRRANRLRQRFWPEISILSAGREAANGDRCAAFTGTGCRYYIALCDGMGTGAGAAREGQSALQLLRQMLVGGFPAEYALRSVNSLLVLRGRAAAVTLDLAEVELDSGRVTVYKWGGAPSWVVTRDGAEKIGTATPPPGLSVSDGRESVQRLSLRRGEVLIMVSDGVEAQDALSRMDGLGSLPPGEAAAKLLELGAAGLADDATVAAVRLRPGNLSP